MDNGKQQHNTMCKEICIKTFKICKEKNCNDKNQEPSPSSLFYKAFQPFLSLKVFV
jgi:hypothetical protein